MEEEEEEEGGIQMCPCLPTNTLGRHEGYSLAIAKESHHCPSTLTSQKGTVFLLFDSSGTASFPKPKC